MKKWLMKDIEIQDKKVWKTIVIGIVYVCSVFLILKVGTYLLQLPLIFLQKYNISVSELTLLYGNSYIWAIISIMIISVLTIPIYIALSKIKKRWKRWY